MPVPIRILCLDDDPIDAQLIHHQLERSADPCTVTTVVDRIGFLTRLAEDAAWDAIISDWRIPGYSGMQALADARRQGCDAPFLVVSGNIGIDEAVEAIKAGVADYVLKDRLEHLGVALSRSLEERRSHHGQVAAQKRLAESEERFRLLTELAQDHIILSDQDGRILYLNPTVLSTYGTTLEAMAGQPVEALLPPECGGWFRQHLSMVLVVDGPREGEMCVPFAQGERWFDVRSIPYRTQGDAPVGVLTVASDVTSHKTLEKTLRDTTAAAQAASVAKSQFLAMMSHELRTPLNGLLGMTGLLAGAGLEPRLQELAELAHRSGEALLQLISGILDFSHLDAGTVHIERKAFNLHQLVGDVIGHFRTQAQEKSLLLQLELDAAMPALVEGDALRLRQVLAILIGNAVKFTDCGHVRVQVAPGPDLGERMLCRIAVTDTGIGIADADLQRLFKPFSQIDGSLTRRHGGCGIGLVVARRLAEMMEGTLEVESSAGIGSCFTMRIPLSHGGDTRPSQPVPMAHRTHPPLVLVADDDAVNRLVIERMLLALGCRVALAEDGREALRACTGAGPDLVLMDIQMPRMDGWEATIAIRGEERGRRHVPIVAVTAYVSDESRERCRTAGMDDFLLKPIDMQVLKTAVATHTGWSPAT